MTTNFDNNYLATGMAYDRREQLQQNLASSCSAEGQIFNQEAEPVEFVNQYSSDPYTISDDEMSAESPTLHHDDDNDNDADTCDHQDVIHRALYDCHHDVQEDQDDDQDGDLQDSHPTSTETDYQNYTGCTGYFIQDSSDSDSTKMNKEMCTLDSEINLSGSGVTSLTNILGADSHLTCKTSVNPGPTGNTARRSTRCRKRSIPEDAITCPNCNLSVKRCDMTSHLHTELYKLEKLTKHRKSYDSTKRLPVTSNIDSVEDIMDAQTRYKQYLSIRTRRERRNRASKKKKGPGDEAATCPVCNEKIIGSEDQLAEHVDQCLQQQDADGDVDLDVDGDENYEEYTWAGQTRIRATSLLEGGPAASGFTVAKRTASDEDDNIDLDIDGDDCSKFGESQYSEADLIPCGEEEARDEKERKALRNAVLRGEGARRPKLLPPDRKKWKQNTKVSEDKRILNNCEGDSDLSSHSEVVECLKAKIKEQEALLQKVERPKCLICMDWYTKPLTSVQCWHVHCEECWLRTLGTKKLCPQCNMITSPSDLRRIYL